MVHYNMQPVFFLHIPFPGVRGSKNSRRNYQDRRSYHNACGNQKSAKTGQSNLSGLLFLGLDFVLYKLIEFFRFIADADALFP